MAGDWLPMRHDLPEDPAVISIACATDLDEDAVVGKLLRVWRWFDKQTTDGNAVSVTQSWLDRHIGVNGFALAMIEVRWLEDTGSGLRIPRFDTVISKSAKQRALTAKRVAKSRAKTKRICNDVSVTDALAKEEKRREELNPPLPPLEARAAIGPAYPAFDEMPAGGREESGNIKIPGWVSMLPIPAALETLEFRHVWNSWVRHLFGKSRRGPTQDCLEDQLCLMAPFGPHVASLAILRAKAANWSEIDPERSEREWRAWLGNELSDMTLAEFNTGGKLDAWWMRRAPAHLRNPRGRLLNLSAAFQAHAESHGHRSPGTRYIEILAAPDPWSLIDQAQRDAAAAKLATLGGSP